MLRPALRSTLAAALLGLATLTEMAGLSLALGAFVAGMLISETEYRLQVEEDIKPFRDVLMGLFFVTIGMMLNPTVIWKNLWLVLALVVGVLLIKALVVFVLSRLFGGSQSTALRSARRSATLSTPAMAVR